ncbi:hypothetical protein [Vibrio neptunius]|uniref:hypothetical protein n=1 Tax=Vibrio neptunius TaxID=170651 RepID=UPI001C5CB120|nr:hypothetical protein [Vibrio neptunius]QXX09028.1 hypothetical protein KW548_18195 [Vibrio neptunius]
MTNVKHYSVKLCFASALATLAGCGGGDSSSSTNSNPDSNVTRYSSNYAASGPSVGITYGSAWRDWGERVR